MLAQADDFFNYNWTLTLYHRTDQPYNFLKSTATNVQQNASEFFCVFSDMVGSI